MEKRKPGKLFLQEKTFNYQESIRNAIEEFRSARSPNFYPNGIRKLVIVVKKDV